MTSLNRGSGLSADISLKNESFTSAREELIRARVASSEEPVSDHYHEIARETKLSESSVVALNARLTFAAREILSNLGLGLVQVAALDRMAHEIRNNNKTVDGQVVKALIDVVARQEAVPREIVEKALDLYLQYFDLGSVELNGISSNKHSEVALTRRNLGEQDRRAVRLTCLSAEVRGLDSAEIKAKLADRFSVSTKTIDAIQAWLTIAPMRALPIIRDAQVRGQVIGEIQEAVLRGVDNGRESADGRTVAGIARRYNIKLERVTEACARLWQKVATTS